MILGMQDKMQTRALMKTSDKPSSDPVVVLLLLTPALRGTHVSYEIATVFTKMSKRNQLMIV